MKGGHTSPHDALLTEREFRYFHAHAFHRSVSGSSAGSDAKCHWRDGDATKVRLHGTKPGVRGDTAPELPFRSGESARMDGRAVMVRFEVWRRLQPCRTRRRLQPSRYQHHRCAVAASEADTLTWPSSAGSARHAAAAAQLLN